MIALLQAVLLGAVAFAEQDIAGLEVGTPGFPASTISVNTQLADVNRDGQADLVLPKMVYLQIAGRYPGSAAVRHPENGDFSTFRIEGDLFYGYRSGRLVCYRYQAGTWSLFWEETVSSEMGDAVSPIFNDLDGDGHTELLLPGATTLNVFRIARGTRDAGILDIYPPRRPDAEILYDFWTPRGAPVTPPGVSRRFRVSFSPPSIRVHESLAGTPELLEHRFTSFQLVSEESGSFSARRTDFLAINSVPAFMLPCRLNADDDLDFAGVRATSESASWSPPSSDIVISVGGRTDRQYIRTKGLAAHVSASDFDADKDLDVFTQTTPLLFAPPREVFMAAASQRRINHIFYVHVQELDGMFDPTARELLRTSIRFERPLVAGGERWDVYRTGGLTSTQGDFNADGRADIAVWRTPREIAIHLNHEGVFEEREDVTLSVPREFSRMAIADVDSDGKSDVVLVRGGPNDGPIKVYFSR